MPHLVKIIARGRVRSLKRKRKKKKKRYRTLYRRESVWRTSTERKCCSPKFFERFFSPRVFFIIIINTYLGTGTRTARYNTSRLKISTAALRSTERRERKRRRGVCFLPFTAVVTTNLLIRASDVNVSRGTGFERDENLIISVSARARRFFSFSRRRSFFFPLVPRYRPYFRYFRTDLLLPVVRFFLFLLCRSARERCPEDGTCQQRLLSRAFFGKFFFFFNNFHSPRRSGEACNVCEAMQERDTILDYEEFASVLQIHRRPLFFLFSFSFVRIINY